MSNVVDARTYADGDRRIKAEVLDNGCVRLTTVDEGRVATAALGYAVLEQLAAMARKAERHMSDGPRPCSATEAVARALSLVGHDGQYVLGTGDYKPHYAADGRTELVDLPWTENYNMVGSDCAGFAECWAYKLPRHRPGYNRGAWSTCEDDLNCNSALEDAQHGKELFDVVTDKPQPGDLLLYPTIYLTVDGQRREFVGHVAIVTGVSRATAFDLAKPDWSLLDVAQCCGPNGRKPAVIASDGAIWNQHDHLWPKPEHRSWLIRALP